MSLSTHHLYVHVPFCRLVCAYCDFVTVGGRGADVARYPDVLLAEMSRRPASGQLTTIYFGGGTPSLMAAEGVRRVIGAAVEQWGHAPGEVT
ncbi:MAG: radical SAM protein, partial [Candidatus Limnocylindria bacterium]